MRQWRAIRWALVAVLCVAQPVMAQRIVKAAPLGPVGGFDGQTVNARLASQMAENATMLGWTSCSVYLQANGSLRLPSPNRRNTGTLIPCVYVATGSEADFNEYFVLEPACDDGQSRRLACRAGYAVDMRVRNRVAAINDPDYQVEVVRDYFTARFAPREAPSAVNARRTTGASSDQMLVLQLDKVGSTTCKFGFSALERRSWCQAYDAAGSTTGPAVEEEVVSYVAYSDASITTCADVGDYVSKKVDEEIETADNFLNTVGPTAGGLLGLAVGAAAGAEPTDMAKLVGAGGAVGKFAVGVNQFGISTLGGVKKVLLSGAAELICDASGVLDPAPSAPEPPGDLPIFNPDPPTSGGSEEGALCWMCTSWLEITATVYDSDGNVVDTEVSYECLEEDLVPCEGGDCDD